MAGLSLLMSADPSIHSTAVVDEPCEIGAGTRVWHFCHVCAGATIGVSCSLGQNTMVSGGAVIGNNVKVQNNVSIYDGVTIEDDVFLGPSCVLTNITNPRSQIVRKDLYEGTLIQRGATIGANATIVCGVTIGEYAFIGAGAVINTDVKPYALMVGIPAKQKGWMSKYGEKLELPLTGNVKITCPNTETTYTLSGDKITDTEKY